MCNIATHTDIQTYRHTDRQTDMHAYIHTYIHTYIHDVRYQLGPAPS